MTRKREEKKANWGQSECALLVNAAISPCGNSSQHRRCRRDKLKAEVARVENEKTDLGLELSFVRDKLQQKTATADNLELELLELGAKLDKSTKDYVSLRQHLQAIVQGCIHAQSTRLCTALPKCARCCT